MGSTMTSHCYAIFRGQYGTPGRIVTIYDLKKDAVNAARQAGYKYNKAQNLFLRDEESRWVRIDKIDKNALFY